MLGLRTNQRGMFEADHLYLDYVGRSSFYGFLACQRGQLFNDEEFAEFYCLNNGRDKNMDCRQCAVWTAFHLLASTILSFFTSSCSTLIFFS